MKCCPESIKMTLNKIFSCTILSRASRKTFYRVLTWAVLPWGYLRQHWTGFFPVNYCPEPQGQHWLDNIPMQCWELLEQHCSGFLHIKCWPKSIGQYWTGFFSYALLSWDPKTTLHKVFPVQCCSRKWFSWDNIAQIKTLCIVALEAPCINAQEKILFNVVLILLGQYCTGQNPMHSYNWNNIPQENYLCNIGPKHTVIFSQENNL